MATIIQAWYRGRRYSISCFCFDNDSNLRTCFLPNFSFRVYRQYNPEIRRRMIPILKTIAKQRKKREREERQKSDRIEEKPEIEPVNLPTNTEIEKIPSPKAVEQTKKILEKTPEIPVKTIESSTSSEETSKKKKVKQQSSTKKKESFK